MNDLNSGDNKLRVGIAGYGVVGQRRRYIIDLHPSLDVVAVSDINYQFDEVNNGIRHVSDYRELLSENIDVLFVCLPNYLAAEVTIAGLRHGCHVFCEKPPGRDLSDISRVIEIERENPGKKLQYGFNHRYHDSIRDALRIIRSGEMGNLINLRGVYGKSGFFGVAGPDWRTDRSRSGGGILLDQGIHLVDIMRLFAGEFVEVKSFVENDYWGYQVEDNAYAILRTNAGVVATLHSSATQWQHKFELEISLDHGAILLSGILSGSKSYGEEKITIIRRECNKPALGGTTTKYLEDNSWRDEVAEFVDTVLKDKSVENGNSRDALKSMELVFEIYSADLKWKNRVHEDDSTVGQLN